MKKTEKSLIAAIVVVMVAALGLWCAALWDGTKEPTIYGQGSAGTYIIQSGHTVVGTFCVVDVDNAAKWQAVHFAKKGVVEVPLGYEAIEYAEPQRYYWGWQKAMTWVDPLIPRSTYK